MTNTNKFHQEVDKCRKTSNSLKKFFDGYCNILKDIYDIDMVITSIPGDITDVIASHKYPMNKESCFNQTSTYNKAWVGRIEGTTNFNGKNPKLFSVVRLFWSFSDIATKFFNGSPNQSMYDDTSPIEEFSFDVTLFIEDFPKIFVDYKKQFEIDKLNTDFQAILDDFVTEKRDLVSKNIAENEDILEILNQKKKINEYLDKLSQLEGKIKENISNKVSKKLKLPQVTNPYIDLGRYNKLIQQHPVSDVNIPKLTEINTRFQEVKAKHPELFL